MLPDFLSERKKPLVVAAVILVIAAAYLMSQRPPETGAPSAYPSSVKIPEGSTATTLPNDDSGEYFDKPPPVQSDPA